MMTFVFILCVFLTVYYGFINVVKAMRGHAIQWPSLVPMSIGVTGIVCKLFGLY